MGVKRWLVGLVAAGSMLGLAGVSVAPAVAGELAHERLAGPSGVETSLAVAKHTWGTTWPVVYVASNRNPVDALPAATIGDGPVVLTDGKSLNLGGVKPGKIVLLGGTGAVPQAIEDQAKASGVEVVRLAGADRNATAVAIAKQWVKVNGTPKNVYITKNTGSGSPDAVAASVLRDGPILTFTNDASAAALPGVVSELKAGKVTALGGTAVVPDSVLNTAAGGKATARLAGANRYETAFTIAKYAKAQKSGSVVYLASGTALKDAMVAGAAKDGVILLSPANGEGVKAKADALGASKLMIIGGTGVMPDATVQAATTGIIPRKSLNDLTLQDVKAMPDINFSSLQTLTDESFGGADIYSVYYFLDEKRENLYRISVAHSGDYISMRAYFPKGKERPLTKEELFSIAPTPQYFEKAKEDMEMNRYTSDKYRGVMFAPTGLYVPTLETQAALDCSNMVLEKNGRKGNYCQAIAVLPDGVKFHTNYGPGMTCGLMKNGVKCFRGDYSYTTEDKEIGWVEGQTVRVQKWTVFDN